MRASIHILYILITKMPPCELMMNESTSKISKTIIENLSLTWEMYSDAINNIPDEHWQTGEIDYLIPARLILHVLETLDGYSTTASDKFTLGYRFNLNWKTASAEQLPNKSQLNICLSEVKKKTERWINGLKDADFHSPEFMFPWTGTTTLGRILYSLEHCRQHLGELNGELRRRGLPRIKWTSFRT
jgi:hypothetical protein